MVNTPSTVSDSTAGTRLQRRTALRGGVALAIGLIVLALAWMASVMLGSKLISATDIWGGLSGNPTNDAQIIVWDLRLPRAVNAVIVGLCLAAAGALIQGLTRNPLADPGILGVNAGSAFAMTLGVAFFGVTGTLGYTALALAGAFAATVAVYVIGSGGRGSAPPLRLTLAGVAVAALLGGLTTAMFLLRPYGFELIRSWLAGSVVARSLTEAVPILGFVAVGVVFAAVASRSLDALSLGDDLAASLGVSLSRSRLYVVTAVALLVGSATALAGPIAFVGLMVPHLARRIVGPHWQWVVALSMVFGPILVLLADILARFAVQPSELPVGVVTAFIGAPVLIAVVRHAGVSRL